MTVRPINFRDFEVRALLEGRKTQTRRIIKPVPEYCGPAYASDPQNWHDPESWGWENNETGGWDLLSEGFIGRPRYAPGDLLWCREAALPDFPKEFSYYDWSWREVPEEYRHPEHVIYRATWEGSPTGWRPSIHMPRWASRLTLRVTDVRVQRVQDVTISDCADEGVLWNRAEDHSRKESFARFWNTLHKPPHDWDGNPWVAAITFDVIRKNVDEVER